MGYPFSTALVTGASSGIGAAIVERLAAAGVPTVLVARRVERLDALAGRHAGCETLAADLTTADGQHRVAERVASQDAPVDLVVNNAGFGTGGAFVETDPDRLDAQIQLNVAALTRLSHAALTAMVPRGRGWLLNVSSLAGLAGVPHLAAYAATKAYVTSLTEALHAELAGTGVRVTALCPGLTRTEFQQVSQTEHYEGDLPEFVWSSADEVAVAGLDAVVRGRTVAVPGVVNKAAAAAAGITPRSLTRLVTGFVQRR